MKKVLLSFLLMLLPMLASAETVEIDGIYYNLIPKGNVAEVTWNPNIGIMQESYSGSIEIPASVTNNEVKYSVTSIGDYAFSFCSALTSVTIPNSVTSIGEYAFQYCSALTSVNISDLAAWCNIMFEENDSNPLYYAHHLYINGNEITNLVIPNSVTSIGNYAFYGCSGLTSVTIPNSVTSIGERAFKGCSGLTSITIPNSVTTISSYAFSDCTSLTSVTIPNSVTSIGIAAFGGCSALTSVTIPNSVTSIGDNAFSGCSSLPSVTISNYVTSIGDHAFSGCSALTSVTIPNSVTSIGDWAFCGCTGLTSITLPNGLTTFGQCAFDCTGLSSVTIPNNVTNINYYAFSGCNNLSSVTIGEKVSNIFSGAFANCQQLTDVYCLAGNVPNTASDAFNDSYIEYATLHVPAASLSSYSDSEPWKNFKNIVALEEGDIPATQKCATPTIKFENGVVKFSCATSGAEFVSTITPVGNNTKYDSEIVINNTYKVTVYATKAGYNNSDTATIEIQANSGVKGDVNADGKVNAADHVELSKIILNQ